MRKVIVIGAGASGLMAAIMAARNGCEVTLLEAMDKPARKLLMTGNGRCNLTNTEYSRGDCYRGGNQTFVSDILSRFDYQDTIRFFQEIGVLLQNRNGWIYPVTDQAASVVDCLLLEVGQLPIKCKYREKVQDLKKDGEKWQVITDGWHYEADAVILACGGKAAPVTGSDGSGYGLAAKLGHHVINPIPALVALKCREGVCRKLSGLRTRVRITVQTQHKDRRDVYTDVGELQWTDYGISGIVVFQLSRYVSETLSQGGTAGAELDLLTSVSEEELCDLLGHRCETKSISDALIGILPKKMIPVILEVSQIFDQKPKEDNIKYLCKVIKHFPLTFTDTRGFEAAQVCAGGVDTCEIDAATMESRLQKGIYFSGEILDVDGICGGYNLQWAWSTGAIAGKAAAGL